MDGSPDFEQNLKDLLSRSAEVDVRFGIPVSFCIPANCHETDNPELVRRCILGA